MSWAWRRPCCRSGRCSGPGTGGKTPLKMARCSGGVARGLSQTRASQRRVAWEGRREGVVSGSRARRLAAAVEAWAASPGSKTPLQVVPCTMRLRRQTVRRRAPGLGGGGPFAGVEPLAPHDPLQARRRKSSLERLTAGSQTLSKASDNPRMKHQRTLAESVGAHRCGRRHYCNAMSPGEHRSCVMMKLVATRESVR